MTNLTTKETDMEDWKACLVEAPTALTTPTAFSGKKYERRDFGGIACEIETPEYAEHLRALFQRLELKVWKGRINKKMDLTEGEAADMQNAISFICGSSAEVYEIDPPKRHKMAEGKKRWHIMAAGYYACVGA